MLIEINEGIKWYRPYLILYELNKEESTKEEDIYTLASNKEGQQEVEEMKAETLLGRPFIFPNRTRLVVVTFLEWSGQGIMYNMDGTIKGSYVW